jgi:uncharacterized protein (DUF779 family)
MENSGTLKAKLVAIEAAQRSEQSQTQRFTGQPHLYNGGPCDASVPMIMPQQKWTIALSLRL